MYHIYITLRYKDGDIQLHFTDMEYLIETIVKELDKGSCIIKEVIMTDEREKNKMHIDSYELNKAIPKL